MNLRFRDSRAFLASLSFAALAETADEFAYGYGWDTMLDLSPEDFARWHSSRPASFAFRAKCWWAAVRSIIIQLLALAVCDVRGHRFEDVGSYANGESASDSFQCSRCGFSIDHTYY